jgi:SAM-dependent methyltransferase
VPEIGENLAKWKGFDWRQGGDEWSDWWGGPSSQWRNTLYPRVAEYLPAGRILEIAPGYGRWTQFLREHCDELVGVDLSVECVEACRLRFQKDRRLTFHANDGKSLAAVRDRSIDLAFSFDSLVHVEQDVMDAYLGELARVLTDDGVAFLHHSNLAVYANGESAPRMAHWRGPSASAQAVARSATGLGLSCFRQELIPWGKEPEFLIDSLSWIVRAGSRYDGPLEVVANPAFMDEAAASLRRARRWKRYNVRNAKAVAVRRVRRGRDGS